MLGLFLNLAWPVVEEHVDLRQDQEDLLLLHVADVFLQVADELWDRDLKRISAYNIFHCFGLIICNSCCGAFIIILSITQFIVMHVILKCLHIEANVCFVCACI